MVIIAFAPKSSKIIPNIFCKKFKHCGVIIPNGTGFTLYQFINRNHIEQIHLMSRDIRILGAHGWHFVYVPCALQHPFPNRHITCVGMAKYAIRFHAPFIQTPDALYRAIQVK